PLPLPPSLAGLGASVFAAAAVPTANVDANTIDAASAKASGAAAVVDSASAGLLEDWDLATSTATSLRNSSTSSLSSASSSSSSSLSFPPTPKNPQVTRLTPPAPTTPVAVNSVATNSTTNTTPPRSRLEAHASDSSTLRGLVARRLPGTLRPHDFDVAGHDKVFASAWLNDDDVVIGTKCNRVVVVNTRSGRKFDIPTFNRPSPGFGPAAASSAAAAADPETAAPAPVPFVAVPCTGIHSLVANSAGSLLAVGSGRSSEPIQVFGLPAVTPRALLSGHTDVVFAVDWASDDLLVSGSRDGRVLLWRMPPDNDDAGADDDDGHNDDDEDEHDGYAEAVDDRHASHRMAAAARSASWSHAAAVAPLATLAALADGPNHGKVRDLRYSARNERVAALFPGLGVVRLLDPSVGDGSGGVSATDLRLRHRSEAVCLAVDRVSSASTDLFAVGSEAHVSLLDPRRANPVVMVADSLDDGWGVRALAVDERSAGGSGGSGAGGGAVITVGGGGGRIAFFDTRARAHLEWPGSDEDTAVAVAAASRRHLDSGPGWLLQDESTRDGAVAAWAGAPQHLGHVRNAIYTLSYDRTGRRLFAAGGPLQLTLCGSYAALWQ
ncbi:hypothetical protein HK405_007947, partial [Cladochytrium tenue]